MDIQGLGNSIPWTPYIPHQPTPKQLAFLMLPHREAFYGGAAGGGKSDALLMACLQYVDVPGYSAIIFRKTLSDLKLPNSLLDRAHNWLTGTPCKFKGDEHTYYFPTYDPQGFRSTDSRIVFGYVGASEGIFHRYQSAEFQCICFDELTQHSQEDYEYLFSRLRRIKCTVHYPDSDPTCHICQSSAKVPLRVRAASNPGGTGHLWVKERFAIDADPLPDGKVRFIGKNPNRPYIPAFVRDNPHLDEAEYLQSLDELDPVTRERLRNGDWSVSEDARFKPNWFRRYSVRGNRYVMGPDGQGKGYTREELLQIFFTIDPAASAKEGPGDTKRYKLPMGGSWTVIAVWGLTPDYELLLLDIRRFRKEIPEVFAEVKDCYKKWRPSRIGMESVGVGKGAFQLCSKRGLPVFPLHPHTDKVVRSTEAMIRASQGKIWLPQHPGPLWVKPYEAELFTWTGHPWEIDDQVDVTSYAAQMVSWEAAGAEMETEDTIYYDEAPGAYYVNEHMRQGYSEYSFHNPKPPFTP